MCLASKILLFFFHDAVFGTSTLRKGGVGIFLAGRER